MHSKGRRSKKILHELNPLKLLQFSSIQTGLNSGKKQSKLTINQLQSIMVEWRGLSSLWVK
jgi:hypothetical protein